MARVEAVRSILHSVSRDPGSENQMTPARLGSIGILCGALGISLHAADLSKYRGLEFGMTLAAAAKHVGAQPADTKLIHQRPAVIQQMDWTPRQPLLADTEKDPVKEALLCFFNGALSRIIVTYDRYKIKGMTAEDVIDAISLTYGAPTKPEAQIAYHSNYAEVARVLARWDAPEYSYDLVRTGDQSTFAMVLYSKRLDALAQASIIQAIKLEAQEAPQREIDRQKEREKEERLLLEKARSANKPNFRP